MAFLGDCLSTSLKLSEVDDDINGCILSTSNGFETPKVNSDYEEDVKVNDVNIALDKEDSEVQVFLSPIVDNKESTLTKYKFSSASLDSGLGCDMSKRSSWDLGGLENDLDKLLRLSRQSSRKLSQQTSNGDLNFNFSAENPTSNNEVFKSVKHRKPSREVCVTKEALDELVQSVVKLFDGANPSDVHSSICNREKQHSLRTSVHSRRKSHSILMRPQQCAMRRKVSADPVVCYGLNAESNKSSPRKVRLAP